MSLYMRLVCWWCERKGHDWFPPIQQREFLPWESHCLRCDARSVELPWGWCIGLPSGAKHPIAEHYDSRTGLPREHPFCVGPK